MKKDFPIDILSAVEKPARYTGMEFGSIVKSEAETEVSFCLAFPDTYEIGMSYLGFKILYACLNAVEGILPLGWIWRKKCGSGSCPWPLWKIPGP